MPRLIIAAVAAATLIFVPAAQASFTVSSPSSPTNNPSVSFTHDDGDVISCGVVVGTHDAVTDLHPCTSPWTPPLTVDGDYTIEVASALLNYGQVRHFAVDRTAPAITITGPDDNATQVSPAVVYKVTATDPAGGTVTSLSCTWDSAPAACPDGATPVTLSAGTHELAVTATDGVGNVSKLSRHITIASPQVIVDPGPAPAPAADPNAVGSQGGVLSAGATHASASVAVKKRTRGWTQLKSLTLRNVPGGTTIKVACKGTGCPPKATRQVASKGGTVKITGIAGRRLHPGAVITLTLSAPSTKPQTIRIVVRSTRLPQVS
jgi:hypothetical protein